MAKIRTHPIGVWRVENNKWGDEFRIRMLITPPHIDEHEDLIPAKVTYWLEARWRNICHTDWTKFAHAANEMAGSEIVDPNQDPAISDGICVQDKWVCPNCGCRVQEYLLVYDEGPDCGPVYCESCEMEYPCP